MSKQDENKFETNIKQTLDKSVDNLDANTQSRIRQIRAQAVEKAGTTSQANWFPVMTGALATACVMVFAIMLLIKSPETNIQLLPVDDLELISSSDSLEFFEDLEFYEWLEDDALFG